jgi:hypothetical protein
VSITPDQLQKLQDEAVHLSGLMGHPGWAIVADEASGRLKWLTKALIAENEIEKIRDLQANIRSLEFLLKFPDQMLEVARRATEQATRED